MSACNSVASSKQEPEVGDKKKWLSAKKEKLNMSRYLPENPKVGNFNPQRTFFGSFFVIPERLASIFPFLQSVLC